MQEANYSDETVNPAKKEKRDVEEQIEEKVLEKSMMK